MKPAPPVTRIFTGLNVIEVDLVKAVGAPFPPKWLKHVVERAPRIDEVAARMPEGMSTVAIRITDDDEMERLNREFAGEDHSTDVLSFAGSDSHLGDIAISWPAVVRQARRYKQDTWTELALLTVHGLLHLLGWDHATAAEQKEMTRLTRRILRRSRLMLARGRL